MMPNHSKYAVGHIIKGLMNSGRKCHLMGVCTVRIDAMKPDIVDIEASLALLAGILLAGARRARHAYDISQVKHPLDEVCDQGKMAL